MVVVVERLYRRSLIPWLTTTRKILGPDVNIPATSPPHRPNFSPSTTQPDRASTYHIISPQSPATVQSGLLWRDPCIEDTLADNYRVGDYNVDYHDQTQLAQQTQAEQAYGTPNHHHIPQLPQPSQNQQHRHSLQHPGATPALHDAPQEQHHGLAQAHHPTMPQHQHHHHSSQILMDPSQMAHQRLDPSHFGNPSSGVTPLYHTIPTPTSQTHDQHIRAGVKRQRTDDMEISVHDMNHIQQSELGSMDHLPLGGAYAQAAAAAVGQAPPMHHHHRLPDADPLNKMPRRDEPGGAPSVVGQEGMPEPAQRPKGPKLKFTPEDDQLLIDLKEQKNLTWKQIADFFPGRSSGTLQVRYCTKLKAKTKQWSDEMVRYFSLLLR